MTNVVGNAPVLSTGEFMDFNKSHQLRNTHRNYYVITEVSMEKQTVTSKSVSKIETRLDVKQKSVL